jgi:hypothetical protein
MNGVLDSSFNVTQELNAPWGMAIAPTNFGAYSSTLIVGNYSAVDSDRASLNVFNPANGEILGVLFDENDRAITIDNLWALQFGNGTNGGDSNTLYFSAGIYGEQHGLFGSLRTATSPAPSLVQFSSTFYGGLENDGHKDITVTRTGDLSGTATVNYATVDVLKKQVSDYEIALGKLTFNPGESVKTFRILLVDNHRSGGDGFLALVLSNATGAALFRPHEAQLFIFDDGDGPGQLPNTNDDPQLFVKQQYFDFLNREPDPSGLNFWIDQITSCGSDQACIEIKRINVSAAFFLSIEFQRTGVTLFLTNKLAASTGGYGQFMRDLRALQENYVVGTPGADAQLEANKQAFFNDYVSRPEFVTKFGAMSNAQYVDALLQNRETGSSSAERDPLVAGLDSHTETRATVLRKIGEFPAFKTQEFNRAFVTMEYYGYLRRDPDPAGFNFWLNKLNQFNGDFVKSDMVKAFISSSEYRQRFGPP